MIHSISWGFFLCARFCKMFCKRTPTTYLLSFCRPWINPVSAYFITTLSSACQWTSLSTLFPRVRSRTARSWWRLGGWQRGLSFINLNGHLPSGNAELLSLNFSWTLPVHGFFSIFCSFQIKVSSQQLSTFFSLVENNGFEPLTPCLQSRCSSQLS